MGMAAFGSKLQVESATPDTFTDVAEVTSISGPGFSVDTEDITNHQSTEAWEEVAATIIRTDPISFDCNWLDDDANGQDRLLTHLGNRTLANFKVVFPDGSTEFAFAGYVVGYEANLPHDGKAEASVEIKPSGKPTLWV